MLFMPASVQVLFARPGCVPMALVGRWSFVRILSCCALAASWFSVLSVLIWFECFMASVDKFRLFEPLPTLCNTHLGETHEAK